MILRLVPWLEELSLTHAKNQNNANSCHFFFQSHAQIWHREKEEFENGSWKAFLLKFVVPIHRTYNLDNTVVPEAQQLNLNQQDNQLNFHKFNLMDIFFHFFLFKYLHFIRNL